MLTLPKLLDSLFFFGNAIVLNVFLNVDDKVLDTVPSDKSKNDTSIIVERKTKKKFKPEIIGVNSSPHNSVKTSCLAFDEYLEYKVSFELFIVV